MKRAGVRDVVVDNLGERHADGREEDSLGRLAKPEVLARRRANDDRRIDRIAARRDCRDVHDWKIIDRRVIARVVSKRALGLRLAPHAIALNDDLRIGRDLQVDGLALDHINRLISQPASNHVLVDVLGQRHRTRVRRNRIGSERKRDFHAPLAFAMIGSGVLVHLPMQTELILAVLLEPIHADVAAASNGILRDHVGERHVRPTIVRPLELDRQEVEIRLGPDDLLAGTRTHDLGTRIRNAFEAAERLHLVLESLWRLEVEQLGDLVANRIELVAAERQQHPTLRAELVDQKWDFRSLDVAAQQGRTATLERAVGDLRDLEIRVDLLGDLDELALTT